jgi:hypothetical protein
MTAEQGAGPGGNYAEIAGPVGSVVEVEAGLIEIGEAQDGRTFVEVSAGVTRGVEEELHEHGAMHAQAGEIFAEPAAAHIEDGASVARGTEESVDARAALQGEWKDAELIEDVQSVRWAGGGVRRRWGGVGKRVQRGEHRGRRGRRGLRRQGQRYRTR